MKLLKENATDTFLRKKVNQKKLRGDLKWKNGVGESNLKRPFGLRKYQMKTI